MLRYQRQYQSRAFALFQYEGQVESIFGYEPLVWETEKAPTRTTRRDCREYETDENGIIYYFIPAQAEDVDSLSVEVSKQVLRNKYFETSTLGDECLRNQYGICIGIKCWQKLWNVLWNVFRCFGSRFVGVKCSIVYLYECDITFVQVEVIMLVLIYNLPFFVNKIPIRNTSS